MFLCDKCHDASQHVGFRSLGRCEGCGKSAACIDCHYSVCEPPKSKPVASLPDRETQE